MDTSVCKVLLKALHTAGRFDDADRVYADVCKLTHTSHWSSVHTAVQTIDFHTYSVHMCYAALRSVFAQMLVNYQAKQAHTANGTNGYTNGNATATGSSASIDNSVNQNDPYQDLVIITGIGKSRTDGEASVIKPCIQEYLACHFKPVGIPCIEVADNAGRVLVKSSDILRWAAANTKNLMITELTAVAIRSHSITSATDSHANISR
eukprot:16442-Heterococcus_DN1.PRE.8